MKPKFTLIVGLIFFLFTGFWPLGSQADNLMENEKISLLSAIEKISKEYDVYFTFDMTLVSEVKVEYEHKEYSTAEEAVSAILEGTVLKYKFYDKRFVILYKNGEEGLESLKKMSEHLDGLIDEEEIANSTISPKSTSAIAFLPPRSYQRILEPVSFSVSGIITDEKGEPLIGVNIQVKGSSKGTSTDFEGKFSLSDIDENAIIIVSYIGYQTQEISIAGQSELAIALVSDSQLLDEVVVVGYGTMKRSDLTGAVSTLGGDRLALRGNSNLGQALDGQIAGVSVYNSSGAPGRTPRIRIRGINSINAGLEPLYVVDGVTGVDPSLIDPNDIESMEVLKDASSMAIYGARGSNGVILITTKSGVKDNMVVSFKSNIANRRLYRHVKTLDSDGFMEIYNRAFDNAQKYDPMGWEAGKYDDRVRPEDRPNLFDSSGKPLYNTNWEEIIYAPTWSNSHNLAVRGGSDKIVFSLSGGFVNDNGIMVNSNYKRYNGRFSIDADAKPWLKIGGSLTANRGKEHAVDHGSGGLNVPRMVIEAYPVIPVKLEDGSWSSNEDFTDFEGGPNPLHVATERYWEENKMEVRGDSYISIDILKTLNFKTTFSSILNNRKNNFYSGKTLKHISAPDGEASVSDNVQYYWQSENYFTWDPQLNENHNFNALLGFSWLQNRYESLGVTARKFLDDFYQWKNLGASEIISKSSVSGGYSGNSMNSYFTRLNYNYKQKYLITLTGRYDGSSVFGQNNKYAFFPSVGLAWRVSQEDFFPVGSNLSDLKIRISAGSTGNQAIGSYNSLKFLAASDILFAGDTQTGLVQSSLGNSDLRWETTDQYDLGIEAGLFDSKVSVELDLYYKKTRDLLFNRPLPWSTGLGSVTQNIGDLENKGVEVSLTTQNFDTKNFSWTTTLNWSTNKNTVLRLGQNDDDLYPGPWFLGETNILRVGESIGSFIGYTRLGTWATSEADEAAKYNLLPGDIKWKDINGDGVINESDAKIIGQAYPKWVSSLINTLYYKNFDLSFDIHAEFGASIYNTTKHSAEDRQTISNSYASVLDSWTPENQDAVIAEVRPWGTPYSTHADDHWLEDGSFIRGQNIMFGYTLPDLLIEKININNLRLYFSVQNWFLITKYSGYDPVASTHDGQLVNNIEFFQYPKPRIFRLGIEINL